MLYSVSVPFPFLRQVERNVREYRDQGIKTSSLIPRPKYAAHAINKGDLICGSRPRLSWERRYFSPKVNFVGLSFEKGGDAL
jgi:hypothetical protein